MLAVWTTGGPFQSSRLGRISQEDFAVSSSKSVAMASEYSTAELVQSGREQLDRVDALIIEQMDRWSVPVLRAAIGIVFIWFGLLKVIGLSPAEPLIAATVYVISPSQFIPVLGIWEVIIGLCLLYRPLIRVGILLLFLQLPGTFLPIVLLPEVVFTTFPYGLTVEGQYIVKNLVIIGAALVIGGTVRSEDRREV